MLPIVAFVPGGRYVVEVRWSRSSLYQLVLCRIARSTWSTSFSGPCTSVGLAL